MHILLYIIVFFVGVFSGIVIMSMMKSASIYDEEESDRWLDDSCWDKTDDYGFDYARYDNVVEENGAVKNDENMKAN